jgi:hypothetical protein
MAVKVMVAPVIARAEAKQERPAREPRARRRRSSVYDANGNEVYVTLMCLKCHKMRPLSQFGLRKMADGAIRNQPWCRTCRSGAGSERPRERREAAVPAGSSPVATAPAPTNAPSSGPSSRPVSAGTVADQIAAALVWGK